MKKRQIVTKRTEIPGRERSSQTDSPSVAHYRFGEFTLDLDREALFRNDVEIRLRPKCFQVLRVLVKHHGRLVTKRHLHEAVWAPSVVTDDSLAQCLIEIRRALGAEGPDMIRTVPRRGYVFEPDVEVLERGRALSSPGRAQPASPLVALTLLALAGAAFVVFRAAETLPAGKPSVSDPNEEYRTQPARAARAVPADIEPAAYQHYLRGRFFYDRRAPGDVDRAERAYRQAVESDPSFADAWVGLAAVYDIRIFDGGLPREEALYRLGEAAHRAIALNSEDGETLARMARYFSRIGQTRLAAQHFDQALALEPDNPLLLSMLAGRLFHAARLDDAVAVQRRAVELAPLSPVYSNNLVSILLSARRTAEALEVLENLEALTPSDTQRLASFAVDVLALEGRFEEALEYAATLEDDGLRDSRLAITYEALGSTAEANAAFERLKSSSSAIAPYHVAEVFAWRGDVETALQSLVGAGDPEYLRSLATPERLQVGRQLLSPLLAPLRHDPQWQALISATQPDIDLRDSWLVTANVR